jgi:hypothetical protein
MNIVRLPLALRRVADVPFIVHNSRAVMNTGCKAAVMSNARPRSGLAGRAVLGPQLAELLELRAVLPSTAEFPGL